MFPKIVVPQNIPKWSFLVGKPMVVGYHHFRKPPNLPHVFLITLLTFHASGAGAPAAAAASRCWGPLRPPSARDMRIRRLAGGHPAMLLDWLISGGSTRLGCNWPKKTSFFGSCAKSTACAITEAGQLLPSFAGSPLQPQMEHLARDSVYEIGSIRAMKFTLSEWSAFD